MFPGFNLRFAGLTDHREHDATAAAGIKLLLNDGSWAIVGDSSSESNVGKWIGPERKDQRYNNRTIQKLMTKGVAPPNSKNSIGKCNKQVQIINM